MISYNVYVGVVLIVQYFYFNAHIGYDMTQASYFFQNRQCYCQ